MNLSGIFSGLSQSASSKTTSVVQNNVNENPNKSMPLTTGQTLSGRVLSFSNGQISLSVNGSIVNANVTSNLSLSDGQELTFSVKQGENGQIILTPLYENTANSENITSALLAARIPLTTENQFMVSRMMTEGLSISKESVGTMFHTMEHIGMEHLEEAIGLTKLGILPTEENIVQYGNYQNLTHALQAGMDEILLEIPNAYQELLEEGNVEQANHLQKFVLSIFLEQNTEKNAENGTFVLKDNSVLQDSTHTFTELSDNNEKNMVQSEQVKEVLQNEMPHERSLQGSTPLEEILSKDEITQLGKVLNELQIKRYDFSNQQSGLDLLKTVLNALEQNTDGKDFSKLFLDKGYQKLVQNMIEGQWLERPEDVGKEGSIKELYSRLFDTSRELYKALGTIDVNHESSLSQSVQNLRSNLDFMNQINQFSTYVQLPLKLDGQNGNGDLYVFTDKKSLAKKDGNVTALLHLDMDSLGPLDVFVAMTGNHVRTKFYLSDEDIIDFIAENIHMLDERLNARGYSMNSEVLFKDALKEEGVENGLMGQLLKTNAGGNMIPSVTKGFDMKA